MSRKFLVPAKLSCVIQRYVTQALPFLWPVESVSSKGMIREEESIGRSKLCATGFLEIVSEIFEL